MHYDNWTFPFDGKEGGRGGLMVCRLLEFRFFCIFIQFNKCFFFSFIDILQYIFLYFFHTSLLYNFSISAIVIFLCTFDFCSCHIKLKRFYQWNGSWKRVRGSMKQKYIKNAIDIEFGFIQTLGFCNTINGMQ